MDTKDTKSTDSLLNVRNDSLRLTILLSLNVVVFLILANQQTRCCSLPKSSRSMRYLALSTIETAMQAYQADMGYYPGELKVVTKTVVEPEILIRALLLRVTNGGGPNSPYLSFDSSLVKLCTASSDRSGSASRSQELEDLSSESLANLQSANPELVEAELQRIRNSGKEIVFVGAGMQRMHYQIQPSCCVETHHLSNQTPNQRNQNNSCLQLTLWFSGYDEVNNFALPDSDEEVIEWTSVIPD